MIAFLIVLYWIYKIDHSMEGQYDIELTEIFIPALYDAIFWSSIFSAFGNW